MIKTHITSGVALSCKTKRGRSSEQQEVNTVNVFSWKLTVIFVMSFPPRNKIRLSYETCKTITVRIIRLLFNGSKVTFTL